MVVGPKNPDTATIIKYTNSSVLSNWFKPIRLECSYSHFLHLDELEITHCLQVAQMLGYTFASNVK